MMSVQVDLKDVALVITALFSGAATIIGAMNRKTARGTKQAVVALNLNINGRLTQLLEATKEAAHYKGVKEGAAVAAHAALATSKALGELNESKTDNKS